VNRTSEYQFPIPNASLSEKAVINAIINNHNFYKDFDYSFKAGGKIYKTLLFRYNDLTYAIGRGKLNPIFPPGSTDLDGVFAKINPAMYTFLTDAINELSVRWGKPDNVFSNFECSSGAISAHSMYDGFSDGATQTGAVASISMRYLFELAHALMIVHTYANIALYELRNQSKAA
jgi:hypothetical protein